MSDYVSFWEQIRAAEDLQRAERVVRRCGAAAHLVPDTLLEVRDMRDNIGPAKQALVTAQEVANAMTGLLEEPLLTALQAADITTAAAADRCQHCQCSRPLRVVSRNRSGSSAEGLDDLRIGESGTSDFDVMYEFDVPFRWWRKTDGASPPARISPQSAPQVWAKPTSKARIASKRPKRSKRL